MARYIDKDFVIEHLKFLKEENVELTYDMLINEFIEILPTEDVAPIVRGKWEEQTDKSKMLYGWYFCSNCNAVIGEKTPFCSQCGARMEESEEEK